MELQNSYIKLLAWRLSLLASERKSAWPAIVSAQYLYTPGYVLRTAEIGYLISTLYNTTYYLPLSILIACSWW